MTQTRKPIPATRPRPFVSRLVLVAGLALAFGAQAREVPTPDPAGLGFDVDRLSRIDAAAQSVIEEGQVAGAVILVQRHGQLAYLKAFGQANAETGEPLRSDALFRIASMTKPITSVATLMLYEEGRFGLDDPIGRYLPALDVPFEVLQDTEDGPVREPARGPITIRHLLTHTSGISYRFMDDNPVSKLYQADNRGDGLGGEQGDLAEWTRRLADYPLVNHPGEAWTYGQNTDVLGRLVEVLSGQTLDAFFRERIFLPLGMNDTHFEVPAADRHRLVPVHRHDAEGRLTLIPEGRTVDGPNVFHVEAPSDGKPGMLSGGGGLVSSAGDYARFLQMLLNGGELDGQRLLGPKTVALLAHDQSRGLPGAGFGRGGFSFGFSVSEGPAGGEIQSAGTLGWGGYYSTDMFWDPEEALLGIMLSQKYPYGHALMGSYSVTIYQALVD